MKKIQITARTRAPEPITQSVLDKAVERGKTRQNTDKVFGLADWLEDQYDPTHNQQQAAAELRRLYAENELLHQRHHDDNVEYTQVLVQRDQLLEALKEIYDWTAHKNTVWATKASAAIRAVEENT